MGNFLNAIFKGQILSVLREFGWLQSDSNKNENVEDGDARAQ
jgi:hypothetical protein